MWMLLLAACASHREEAPEAPPPTIAETTPISQAPASSADRVYRALSQRDGAPDCASLSSLSPTLSADLIELVETATQPPWVAVRAADCLTRFHTADALPKLELWVADPAMRGLSLTIVGALDEAPPEAALPLARAALAGPWADDARERLLKSAHPELVTLAQSP